MLNRIFSVIAIALLALVLCVIAGAMRPVMAQDTPQITAQEWGERMQVLTQQRDGIANAAAVEIARLRTENAQLRSKLQACK